MIDDYKEVGLDKDISVAMLRRLQAGYHVDSIQHNAKLVNNFADAKHVFTQ